MPEKLQFQECLGFSDSDSHVFSSGALKKNLTAEQIKEDFLTLGTHPKPLSPSQSLIGPHVKQELSIAAG